MYTNLYNEIASQKFRWKNEEEVRQGWISALSKELNLNFNSERDRVDASYNKVIIEFKDKGKFRGSEHSAKFIEARDSRLKPYILRTAAREGINVSDYIGIGIDAEHVFCAQVIDDEIRTGPLLPFSETSVAIVASACRNSYRRAVTSDNLIEDFGLNSITGNRILSMLISELSSKLNEAEHSKEKMLFEEWQTLYGQIADLVSEQVTKIGSTLGFISSAPKELQIPSSLFVIHTYNSILIKVLAAEIVSAHGLTSYRYFTQHLLTLDDEQLLTALKMEIEDGKHFSKANIDGFVEEAIFSWYIDACRNIVFRTRFVSAIREVLLKISLYRTDELTVARSTDVLKRLYQHLVPDALRKSLGEFYTPDWLVETAVEKLGSVNWIGKRMLDPTCGSGSFLLEVIKRKREAGIVANETTLSIINDIIENVWGFDLNPLAVQTARVNFLISIADLLRENKGHNIELPILLADAVYSPAQDPTDDEPVVRYTIGSKIADLEVVIPTVLARSRKRLDRLFAQLEEGIENDLPYELIESSLISRQILSYDEANEWRQYLAATYQRVMRLHINNWNGIWFRIVRNFFWSATAGEFDFVAGNPPWVRWSKLPLLYRERAKPTCLRYDIFSQTPHHGGNELDISAMITYTVADKWLKGEGSLVFVITQTIFQTPSSEGFRRFKINDHYNLVPISVDDLKELKPFPGVANKTAIALFRKTRDHSARYPINYKIWNNRTPFPKLIPEKLTRSQVYDRVEITDFEASPIDSPSSPWAILRPGRFEELQLLQGKCDWVQGRKGITPDLNGVYFVPILASNATTGLVQISTRPHAGKTDIGPPQTFWVEPDLLFPLLKGSSDFAACRLTRDHSLYTFVPNQGINRSYYDETQTRMSGQFPRTYEYFRSFKDLLSKRSTYKLRMKTAPYFSIYNVGTYTFSPWKVIWAEQGLFRAAVIGEAEVPLIGSRPFVPDHKIFFCDFLDAKPAYFLCGLLNCEIVREFVESHVVKIQIGDVFKHMSIPKFDANNEDHVLLSSVCEYAHKCEQSEYQRALDQVRKIAESILLKPV